MNNAYQRGTIYEASNSFFVRYFTTDRKRVSHKLCDRDAEHNSISCPAVLALRDEHMVAVRQIKPQPTTNGTLITDYWANEYLSTIKAGLKPSTVDGYEDIWEQHLKTHFADRTFTQYEPHHGSKFLTGLIEAGYSRSDGWFAGSHTVVDRG